MQILYMNVCACVCMFVWWCFWIFVVFVFLFLLDKWAKFVCWNVCWIGKALVKNYWNITRENSIEKQTENTLITWMLKTPKIEFTVVCLSLYSAMHFNFNLKMVFEFNA